MAYRVDYIPVETLVCFNGLKRLVRQLFKQLEITDRVLNKN